jgi:hypothetical protein
MSEIRTFSPDEDPLAPAPVSELPARKHRWGEPIAIPQGASGCQETERACIHCGLVKITVHPPHGLAYRAWRTASGMRAQIEHAPPCTGMKEGLPE